MTDQCRLCLKAGELVQSHIIPEFIWKRTYGPDHVTMSMAVDIRHIRVLRKGLRERLLCVGCEQVIKRYEDYFNLVWFQETSLPDEFPAGKNSVLFRQGLEYKKFKLFHLSVIWRCSVARSSDFARVKLGPHEERIRRMLLEGNAGTSDQYPLRAFVILKPGTREIAKMLIGTPDTYRVRGHRVYTGIYAGCVWNTVVSSHSFSETTVEPFSEDGYLLMLPFDLRLSMPRLHDFLLSRRDEARRVRRRRLSLGKK
jgi:hypothetical protein